MSSLRIGASVGDSSGKSDIFAVWKVPRMFDWLWPSSDAEPLQAGLKSVGYKFPIHSLRTSLSSSNAPPLNLHLRSSAFRVVECLVLWLQLLGISCALNQTLPSQLLEIFRPPTSSPIPRGHSLIAARLPDCY